MMMFTDADACSFIRPVMISTAAAILGVADAMCDSIQRPTVFVKGYFYRRGIPFRLSIIAANLLKYSIYALLAAKGKFLCYHCGQDLYGSVQIPVAVDTMYLPSRAGILSGLLPQKNHLCPIGFNLTLIRLPRVYRSVVS